MQNPPSSLGFKITTVLTALLALFLCSSACGEADVTESVVTDEVDATEAVTSTAQSGTTAESEPVELPPAEVATVGGAIIVGTVGLDDSGWYIQPEQPLNVTYEYFLDAPSVFERQTRISMFDPKDDGVEKALYLGQTVTVEGTFRFYRDDFETLYFLPYRFTLGKCVEQSHGAPELEPPEFPDLYDPSVPLPSVMKPEVRDGSYVYNVYMLSEETLRLMGNGFADFYVEFVQAFLDYEDECRCPDADYAEMLSTVIGCEFPLYNACAEPFEYFKHYDPEKGTVTISYKYGKEDTERIKKQFFEAADSFLEGASPESSELENAKSIYHAVSSRMTYDDSAMEKLERKDCSYAYLNGSGVCTTFANVMGQLMTRAGIGTTLAHFDGEDTVGHSITAFKADGELCFCDPTYELSYDSGSSYRYFAMSYGEVAERYAHGGAVRCGRYSVREMTADELCDSLEM